MDYSRAVELGGERTHGGDDLPEVLFLREVQVNRGRSGIVKLGLEIELAEEAQDEDDVKGEVEKQCNIFDAEDKCSIDWIR